MPIQLFNDIPNSQPSIRSGAWQICPRVTQFAKGYAMGSRSRIVISAVTIAIFYGVNAAAQSSAVTLPPSTAVPLPVDTLPRVAATHINFVVVVAADIDRAVAFYTKALGMHERGRAQPDLKNFEVTVGYDNNPQTAGISIKYRNGLANPRGNGSSAINLVVVDLAAMVERVTQSGGKIVLPLARGDTPKASYSFAIVEDPDGNTIELVEYHWIAKP